MKKSLKSTLIIALAAAFLLSIFAFTCFKPVRADLSGGTFEMVDGVSLRLSEGGGIRFRVRFDETVKAEIDKEDVALAFIVAPRVNAEAVKDGDYKSLLDEANKAIKIEADETKIYNENGAYYSNAVITEIKEANRKLEYVSIAYIEKAGEATYATVSGKSVTDGGFAFGSVRGNLYDVLNQAVITSAEYYQDIFALTEYNWFATEEYPIVIETEERYGKLVDMINGGTSFEGKYISINGEIDAEKYPLDSGKQLPDTATFGHVHSYGTPTYTWNGNECTAERTCTDCTSDPAHKETETVTATFKVTDKAQYFVADGKGEYTATFENPAFEEQTSDEVVIDKNGLIFDGEKQTNVENPAAAFAASGATLAIASDPETEGERGMTLKYTLTGETLEVSGKDAISREELIAVSGLYALKFDVYASAAVTGVHAFGAVTPAIATTGEWTEIIVRLPNIEAASANDKDKILHLSGSVGTEIYIDNIRLERIPDGDEFTLYTLDGDYVSGTDITGQSAADPEDETNNVVKITPNQGTSYVRFYEILKKDELTKDKYSAYEYVSFRLYFQSTEHPTLLVFPYNSNDNSAAGLTFTVPANGWVTVTVKISDIKEKGNLDGIRFWASNTNYAIYIDDIALVNLTDDMICDFDDYNNLYGGKGAPTGITNGTHKTVKDPTDSGRGFVYEFSNEGSSGVWNGTGTLSGLADLIAAGKEKGYTKLSIDVYSDGLASSQITITVGGNKFFAPDKAGEWQTKEANLDELTSEAGVWWLGAAGSVYIDNVRFSK